jgi:hypothetical protein
MFHAPKFLYLGAGMYHGAKKRGRGAGDDKFTSFTARTVRKTKMIYFASLRLCVNVFPERIRTNRRMKNLNAKAQRCREK